MYLKKILYKNINIIYLNYFYVTESTNDIMHLAWSKVLANPTKGPIKLLEFNDFFKSSNSSSI